MDRHIEVVGVDHGWSGMKTVSQVFTTGVKEITTEPAFYNNVVEFNGSYYKVGGKRLEVRDLKVENDNFYILTLAAVAKELNRRGMRNANILLSVGLPLTRFGAEKQDFIDYLSKEKEVTFRFDNEQYRIKLARVSVFPQCYAAVADRMKTLPKRVVVVDIGSWTIDIMPIEDSAPNEAECITIREGLIKCMRTINEECIIFNSVSFRTGKKYRYEKGDWARKIQPITNRLCEEYGLSTIEISDDRARPSENYKEWICMRQISVWQESRRQRS